MRAARSKTRSALLRVGPGIVAASAALVAFAPQAQSATHASAGSHPAAIVKFCENSGHFTEDLAVNSKSQEVTGAKSLVRLATSAPNAALKSNLKTLAKRISTAAASYPHPPSDATVASNDKLESKIESEISSACTAAEAGGANSGSSSPSGGSGSSSASTVALACPSAAQVSSALGVAMTGIKVASSPCDYTGPAANPLVTVDYGNGASKASADASAHAQHLTSVPGVGVDAYKGVNGGTTTIIALDAHGDQVVVDVARNAVQGPGAGDAAGAETLAKAVLAG
jgi:hypothetical protein